MKKQTISLLIVGAITSQLFVPTTLVFAADKGSSINKQSILHKANNRIQILGVNNVTINVGETFNLMEGITAVDTADGEELTDSMYIINDWNNNDVEFLSRYLVEFKVPGIYKLTYAIDLIDVPTVDIPVSKSLVNLRGGDIRVERTITVVSGESPVINGTENLTIKEGTQFDPMAGVTANDKEDGNITKDIKVTGKVDINKAGKYELTYTVTDKDKNTTTVKRIITVNPKMTNLNTIPTISAENKTISVGDTFNPLDGVTANDKEDGNITKDIKVIENTVNTNIAGAYTVKYEVTDSKGAKATKTIAVTVEAVAKKNEATSKLAYFKSYGIILEGEVSGDEKYDNTVRKALVIKDKDGTVKLKKDIVSTNWYGDGYSGFQAILTTKDISDIGSVENAKVEIEVNYKGTGKNYAFKIPKLSSGPESGGGSGGGTSDDKPTLPDVPPTIKPGIDLGWQSDYYYVQDLPNIEYGNNIIQFIVDIDGNISLTNKVKDSGFNICSYYKTNEGQYVLDVVVKIKDFNMSNSQNNVFEVKNKDGQVVYTGKVATFADGVFEDAPPKSALQVVVPKEYSNDNHSVEIVIRDKNNVEKGRFKAPKFS